MNIYERILSDRNALPFSLNIINNGFTVTHKEPLKVGDMQLLHTMINEYNTMLAHNGTRIVYTDNGAYIDVNHYFDAYFIFNMRVNLTNDADAEIVIHNNALCDSDVTYYRQKVSKCAVDFILHNTSDYSIITMLEEYAKTNMQPYNLQCLERRIFC